MRETSQDREKELRGAQEGNIQENAPAEERVSEYTADGAESAARSAGPGESAAGRFGVPSARAASSFAQRMNGAGYVTGRRYDAVKNELLRYRFPRTGKGVQARVSKTGEVFSCGRKTLAMLRVSGSTLRLFLALDPKAYSAGRYHHRDMSAKARYARCPMLIRLTSDRQVRYALDLIGQVMAENGLEPDPSYVPHDQAGAFGSAKVRRRTVYVPVPVLPDAETAAENAAPAAASAADALPCVLPPEAVKARLPRRAAVYDRFGQRVGRLRRGTWYDEEDAVQGVLREEGEGVLYYPEGEEAALGYLDGNGNLLTALHEHIATIRRGRFIPLFILFLCLAVIAVLAVLLGALAIPQTAEPYAPTIFLTDEEGVHWEEQEDLPVFVNETFGDSVIAPGMSGSYRFIFENANDDTVTFSFTFTEENEHGIELVYRLVRDGAYVSGTDGYVTAEELSVSGLTLEANSGTMFELQWYWRHNDAADTAAGEAGATYVLHIGFEASVVAEA